jgi:curved DNA-binding protein CbpA
MLHLPPGASAEDVTQARRALARQYHPDAGGGHAMMVSINLAADSILRWLHQTV